MGIFEELLEVHERAVCCDLSLTAISLSSDDYGKLLYELAHHGVTVRVPCIGDAPLRLFGATVRIDAAMKPGDRRFKTKRVR